MKSTPARDELFRWADQIPQPLWNDLGKRPPQQSAEAVGAAWDGNAFKLPLIGTDYTVTPSDQRITKSHDPEHRVAYQTGVVLLTTLAVSSGVPPSGRMAVPQELPGGRMFFTGAHAPATPPLERAFSSDPDRLIAHALKLGGEMIQGADVAVLIPGLPYVPLYVLLWEGDNESPARAVIGIDDRALFHLDLAGVFALTNILVHRLCNDST
jgi:hypothetical protein